MLIRSLQISQPTSRHLVCWYSFIFLCTASHITLHFAEHEGQKFQEHEGQKFQVHKTELEMDPALRNLQPGKGERDVDTKRCNMKQDDQVGSTHDARSRGGETAGCGGWGTQAAGQAPPGGWGRGEGVERKGEASSFTHLFHINF